VGFPDGSAESLSLVYFNGENHVTLRGFTEILQKVDPRAAIEYKYDPPSLRLRVAGKTISINDRFLEIDGRYSPPGAPIQVVDNQFLIPAKTVETINEALGLFEFSYQSPPPGVGAVGVEVTIPETMTPEPLIPPSSLEPPMERVSIEEPETPSLEPAAIDTLPIVIADPERAISISDLAELLKRQPIRSFSRIAIAPEAGSAAMHGSYADDAQSIAEGVAAQLEAILLRTGKFEVRRPRSPVDPESPWQTIEWANSQPCDALIQLCIETSPFRNLGGMRIWVAHEADDASARPPDRGEAFGLPQSLNYIPYQDLSLLLGALIHGQLANSSRYKARPVEFAPSFLMRRLSMPSVTLSLGYITTEKERERMMQDAFLEGAAQAIAKALVEMRNRSQEMAYAR